MLGLLWAILLRIESCGLRMEPGVLRVESDGLMIVMIVFRDPRTEVSGTLCNKTPKSRPNMLPSSRNSQVVPVLGFSTWVDLKQRSCKLEGQRNNEAANSGDTGTSILFASVRGNSERVLY